MSLDRFKPAIYAFVKKNQRVRNTAMVIWNFIFKTKNYVTHLITSAEIYGPPAGVIEYNTKFAEKAGKDKLQSVVSFKLISPEQEITRKSPYSIDGKIHWKYIHNQKAIQPATYVIEVENGRVYDEGAVIIDDNLFAGVSKTIDSGEYINDTTIHPAFTNKTLPPLKKLKGNVAVLSAPSGRGYYHWMFDVLPRIQLLKAAGYDFENIDKFLINNYISKFHIETLAMIGVPRNKIMESQLSPHIQAEKLIVPSLVGNTGSVPKYACDFLRNEFLGKISKNNHHSKRIYVNRGQVVHRRVINEPAIVGFLKKYGFESVALETLSLTEQIALMASAEVVIAPHGAGLTNIVFCDPGTTIIEFLHPASVNVMYWTISNEMDFKYYYLLAKGEVPPEFVNPYLNGDDMDIDIENLGNLLKLAGIN